MGNIKNTIRHYNIVTSKIFWTGAPLVISEIIRRGHYLSVFDEHKMPPPSTLLDCDVYVDMSTITSEAFYVQIVREYNRRKSGGIRLPVMIDPPIAVLNSIDKRKTNKIFSDLVPQSHNLDGKNNIQYINEFISDKYVVVKPAIGWWGKDVERLSPRNALSKYSRSKSHIVQKYINTMDGVGRIVTLNDGKRFKIACSYIRKSDYWRTGTDVNYKCYRVELNSSLKRFAQTVSKRSGLYLNGMDYLISDNRIYLLEVNAVPAIREPLDEFGIDIPRILLDFIEDGHA